jgi:hypothetical protein
MPSDFLRRDAVPKAGTEDDGPSVRAQHHGLFLEPRYTVELPPLDEEEQIPVVSLAASRRQTGRP